jgi:COP9 signalosome complex subunit 6
VRLVHKSPALDLVGWYSLVPKTGPTAQHLPIHRQISAHNDSAVLLGFHIEDMLTPASGDPLPITIYESNMEADDSREAEGEDKEMKDAESATNMVLRFRKLPYTTETGEAEMIAMQFIREGGANATVDGTEKHILEQFDKKIAVDDGKGKRRAVAYEESSKSKKDAPTPSADQPGATNTDANLTRAEAEYMSALQAKYNATKMLKSRLNLLITYLQHLPPSFTAGNQPTSEAAAQALASNGQHTPPSNTILRHIQALVTNADLVAPAEQATLEREIQRETNDVNVISMISDLVASVSEVREAGKKFLVVDSQRQARQGRAGGGPSAAQYEQLLAAGQIGHAGDVVGGGLGVEVDAAAGAPAGY